MLSFSRHACPAGSWFLFFGYMACSLAHANSADPLQVSGGLTYAHDNNLFRLADDSPGYGGQRGDSWRQASVGLSYNQTFGRQVLALQGSVNNVRYDHFSQLNYNGKDYQAALSWYLGSNVDGHAGATYSDTLASYADVRSNERVLRQRERDYVDGGWRFHPRWRVRGGYSRDKSSYDVASQQVVNRIDSTYEAGLDYAVRTGSTVGLVARRTEGRYPLQGGLAHTVFDSSYNQDELKARIVWRLNQNFDAEFLGGRARRTHLYASSEDTSGFNTRVSANWAATSAVSLTAAGWREFSPIESSLVSYSLNRGASVNAVWVRTAKLRFDASMRYEKRDFNRVSRAAFAETGDTSRHSTLGVTFAPADAVQLRASLYRDTRNGAALFGLGAYRATGFMINANTQF